MKGSFTPPEFVKDAICLSGLTGTKLKCDVLGEYYLFWWRITSGGPKMGHRYNTAIIELNAATGEVHIKDVGKTVLGSAGHALKLKVDNQPNTQNLRLFLIEEHLGCFNRLKRVIKRRWPNISLKETEGPIDRNFTNIHLQNKAFEEALEIIERIELGNSLFFFDPLRSVEYDSIEKVAAKRISGFFKTGTEFIIFLFTSDWFLGRDDLAPLPLTTDSKNWSLREKKTVSEANSFFGDEEWHPHLLKKDLIEKKEDTLVEQYKKRLHKWFRYVLPLPFNPKDNQIFHIMLCSNYEIGIRATRNFYAKKTGNPKYSPNNATAYQRFIQLYPETLASPSRGRHRKPLQWLVLWRIITQHEEGICDCMCSDLLSIKSYPPELESLLKWLRVEGFLNPFKIPNAWDASVEQYKLNWKVVKEKLGVDPPLPLKPVSSGQIIAVEDA